MGKKEPKQKILSEKAITKQIRDWLKLSHIFHWKQIGGLGLPAGIADIIGIFRGKFLAIEVKRPGNKLSDKQKAFLENVEKEGGIAIVAYSVNDVVSRLSEELKKEIDEIQKRRKEK